MPGHLPWLGPVPARPPSPSAGASRAPNPRCPPGGLSPALPPLSARGGRGRAVCWEGQVIKHMINFGTSPSCLTAPSPGLGRASARGAASADAAVGGMKNPAMQHCFLMSHLSLSLLDSLPCRERNGSCPKSPSEQLLLEQSEEIRPRRAPAARDPGTAASAGTPRRNRNAGASGRHRRGGSGTPGTAPHAQPSTPRTPWPPEPIPLGQEPCSCGGAWEGAGASQGCWGNASGGGSLAIHPCKAPTRILAEEPLLQKPCTSGEQPGLEARARGEVGWEGQRWHGEGLCPHPQQRQGRQGWAVPRHRHLQPPRPQRRRSPCPREPGHSTPGDACRRWDPTARAAGAQPTESGHPPRRDPQARQGPGDPSPHQLALGSRVLRCTDEHPSPVMPTDGFPPTDALDICPRCLGPAAAPALPQPLQSVLQRGDVQVTPGSPAGGGADVRPTRPVFPYSKGKG